MTPAIGGSRRTVAVLLSTIAILGLADVVRSVWLPTSAHVAFNLGLAAVVIGLVGMASMTTGELGLLRTDLGSGLRWGGAAFAVIAAPIVVAGLVAPGWSVFDDDRAHVGLASLLVRVLVVIPLGTIVLEELAFRGLLLGLFRRLTSTTWSVIAASVLFGLWHIPVAWNSSSPDQATTGRVLSVAGTVVATTAAGVVFCWLRLRSRSLVAPMLAHLATNSVALAVAWTVARTA